jgi:hypothetical protein
MDLRGISLVLSIRLPFVQVATHIVPLKMVLGYFNRHSSISIAVYSRYQRIYFAHKKGKIQHAGLVNAVFAICNFFRHYNCYLRNQRKDFVSLMFLWYRYL